MSNYPRRIVLDIDDTFDAVHGGQQLRLFNAHYDEYGFQPIVVFDGEGRMIAALLRPACRPTGRKIVFWLRRLITAQRDNWPRVEILLRADSHYCTPEVLRFCRAERLDYALGVAPTTTLRKHVAALEASTGERASRAGGEKLRRFEEFYDGAASWDRVERIIARVEAGPQGVDTRFIVTSLDGVRGRTVYQDIYCARGQAENHIKAWKTHLAADRLRGLTRASRTVLLAVLPRCRQPDAPVPAPWRLLADVEPAGRHAATLVLARRPVRYAAPAPGQTCRQGRGAEAQGAAPPAALDPEPADLRLRADTAVSHAHLRNGAEAPRSHVPSTPNAAATEPAQRRGPARCPMPVRQNTPARQPSCIFAASVAIDITASYRGTSLIRSATNVGISVESRSSTACAMSIESAVEKTRQRFPSLRQEKGDRRADVGVRGGGRVGRNEDQMAVRRVRSRSIWPISSRRQRICGPEVASSRMAAAR